MGLDLNAVHLYEKIPGTDQTRLVRMNPYVRIGRKDHPPIYVQAGQVYGEGGQPVDPLPDWFGEEMSRLSPKVRNEIGWRDTIPGPKAEAPAAKPVAQWTCPAEGCGETMPARKKGLHVSAHRKAERAKGA
jgi:hypothetical protein